MLYIIAILALLLLIFGPSMWVNYILRKHHKPLTGIPGTGSELAIHLLEKYDIANVKVEKADEDDDHYCPTDNAVRLSPEVFDGKSLSAIAVAAHEVGHAIQFNRNEPVSQLRDKYLRHIGTIQNAGSYALTAMLILSLIAKAPAIALLTVGIGVTSMIASVILHAATLPEEWDASFNKALPILDKGGYVPQEHLPAIRQILKACALTYFAAALKEVLMLWRWVRFIR